jgi:hypothetical protein
MKRLLAWLPVFLRILEVAKSSPIQGSGSGSGSGESSSTYFSPFEHFSMENAGKVGKICGNKVFLKWITSFWSRNI